MAITDKYVSSLAAGGGDGSLATPWNWTEMLANDAAGVRMNIIKDGTYARTTDFTILANGTAAAPSIFRAVDAAGVPIVPTRGLDGSGDLTTSQMVAVTYTSGQMFTGSNCVVEGLYIKATALAGYTVESVAASVLRNCSFENSHASASAGAVNVNGAAARMINCDALQSNATGLAAATFANAGIIVGGRFKSVGGAAVKVAAANCALIGAQVYASPVGIDVTAAAASAFAAVFCTVYGCTTAGFRMFNNASSNQNPALIGCIFRDNAVAFLSLYAGTGELNMTPVDNRIFGNTTVQDGWDDWYGHFATSNLTSAGDDFASASSGDFRILPTSPTAGAGIMGMDIGAVQLDQGVGVLSGGPGDEPSLEQMMRWVYCRLRNSEVDGDASVLRVFEDGVDHDDDPITEIPIADASPVTAIGPAAAP